MSMRLPTYPKPAPSPASTDDAALCPDLWRSAGSPKRQEGVTQAAILYYRRHVKRDLITFAETAARLGMHHDTLTAYLASGRLSFTVKRIDRMSFIPVAEIEAYEAAGETAA